MNRRDRRKQRGTILPVEPVKFVVDLARARGCICDPPGVRLDGPIIVGEANVIHVEHDDRCPLAPPTGAVWVSGSRVRVREGRLDV